MKKRLLKIKNCLRARSNFISWLFLVLAIEYLFLFSLETILPGFVTMAFNLNILLIFVIISWLLFVFIENDEKLKVHDWFFRVIYTGLIFLIVFSLVIVLYKTTYWESLVYLVLASIAGRVLYDYIK